MLSGLWHVTSPVHVQVVKGQCVDRRKLHEKVTTVANLLRWKGVVPNDRVLMTVAPSVDFYAIAVAVLAIGEEY